MDEETTSKLNPSHHNRSLSRRQGKDIPQNFGYEVKIFKEKKNFQTFKLFRKYYFKSLQEIRKLMKCGIFWWLWFVTSSSIPVSGSLVSRSDIYCYCVRRVCWSLSPYLDPDQSQLTLAPLLSLRPGQFNQQFLWLSAPLAGWGWWGWWVCCCACWSQGPSCRWSSCSARFAGAPALSPSPSSPMTSVVGYVEVSYFPYETSTVTSLYAKSVNLVNFEKYFPIVSLTFPQ